MAALRVEQLYGGQVLRLTVASPPGNYIDPELVDALAEALDAHAGLPCVKLIVLRGAGSDFSLGARLDSAAAVTRFHRLFYRLIELGVPTAAVVRGRCLGAGLDLAAFCNFIFADSTSRFGQPELSVSGLPTPASLILPLKLGSDRSGDLVLMGLLLSAQEAYRRGLLTAWARSPADLEVLVRTWIEAHILPKSARSLRLANRVARLGFHAQLRAELPALERLYLRELRERATAA
jgi:cyclohexa-1,5-dienecarbonyl-CoA hydratase